MDSLKERAARWGIQTEFQDGLGRHREVEPGTLERLIAIVAAAGEPFREAPSESDGSAFQGVETLPPRFWALAVQLYGVKSRRNWGHGDFTDLKGLIDLAAHMGASGVGLNPLHALFDDSADEFSPYYASSRLFLNTHYIDPDAIPEFAGREAETMRAAIAPLRDAVLVNYAAVIEAKSRAFRHAYDAFLRAALYPRRQAFAHFRVRGGNLLNRFSCFEFLRRRHGGPWWTWPQEWQRPDDAALSRLRKSEEEDIGYYDFLQWVANTQLMAARDYAAQSHLRLGLYLDIAVGVRADGFDAWNEQGVIVRSAEIGAPPDPLNLEGQHWGLAGVNPTALAAQGCESFREVLRASMRYAGAVRLDHVMALQRLYLVPAGMRGDQGAYVYFPFQCMLAITAQESVANRCIVIGEDLGTVPEHFRETLAGAGLWSYQVMLFQRAADRGFIAPDMYNQNALVTFSTHDLPTFPGWQTGHDLDVKHALGLDPGETVDERKEAIAAMSRTMAWYGFPKLDYASVMGFLASTPSRLLMVSAEDVLALTEQVNVPGTVAEHPNWRRRLSVDLEDLGAVPMLDAIAAILKEKGRGV